MKPHLCFAFLLATFHLVAQNTRQELPLEFANPTAQSAQTLHVSDIAILEDGVEQTVASFCPSECRDSGDTNLSTVVVLLDASHFMPHLGLRPSSPPPGAETEPIKKAALNALRSFSRNPTVAFYSTRNELHVIRDIPQLDAPHTTSVELSPDDRKAAVKIFDPQLSSSPNAEVQLRLTEIMRFEFAELESIASHVAARPGRKALIWFCDETEFHAPPEEGPLYYSWFAAMSAAQRSNLAVYPINCLQRGTSRLSAALKNLAEWTGGRYYDKYTDLNKAIDQALSDSRSYYTASWQATHARAGPIHRIAVHSKAPLIYPHAVVEPVVPASEPQRLLEAEAGLSTPLSANAIRLNLAIDRQTENAAIATLSIDPSTVTLKANNGTYTGLLDMIYAYYGAAGDRITAGRHDTVALNIKASELTNFLNHSSSISQPLTIPHSAVSLRVVIRDANSGALGSITANL